MNRTKTFNIYPWWIILNPTSGNGLGAKKKNSIKHFLQKHNFEFTLVETQYKEHAYDLVREGIEAGYRFIMAVGGDGTNNEVINGILQQQLIPPTEITYTLIPLGTGNDWIRTHRIPGNWKKWIPKIAEGKTMLHDAGLLYYVRNGKQQKRYFVNVAGLAYDAFVTQKKGMHSATFFPKLYYLWMVFTCLFQYTLRNATIRFNNNTITDYFYTINIGICRYSGGGMQIVPHANPTSGQLALTIAGAVPKIDILLYTPHIFAGKLHRHSKVDIHTTSNINITSAEGTPTLLEADGEFLGETPVKCIVIAKALRVLVP